MKKALCFVATWAALSLSTSVWADSPPNLETPDAHSIPAKGKISLYRVQAQDLGLGKADDKTDAELMVTLDTNPKMIYALQLDANSPAVNKVLADTLRDAYLNGAQVTLYHQIAPGKTIANIHMVQMEK